MHGYTLYYSRVHSGSNGELWCGRCELLATARACIEAAYLPHVTHCTGAVRNCSFTILSRLFCQLLQQIICPGQLQRQMLMRTKQVYILREADDAI